MPWLVRAGLKRVESLLDVAKINAEAAPHDLAYEMGDEHLTWSELYTTTSRIAHALAGAGVRRGDVVALFAENSPFYVALVLGISRVGATAALINTNLRGRTLSHAVGVSNARVVLVSDTLEQSLRECKPLCQSLDRILVFDDNPYVGLLANTPTVPYPAAPVGSDDDFIYIYTSGTTGLPKPCRISHARAVLAGVGFGPLMFQFEPGDKLYCVLPLYHANGLLLGVSSAMICRVPTVMRRSFSASSFWDDVHRYEATAVLYIGELCRYLVNSPPHPKERPNPVRVAVGNGLRPDIWPRFKARFGIETIREFYGATEAPGFIANLSGREGSVGRVPLGGARWLRLVKYDVDAETHVRDARGFCVECDPNEPGELLICISKLASGGLSYRGYTDETATDEKLMRDVFKRGDVYFRSGDLLRRDRDGFFYFVDRIGDTFRWKGENVSTAEVADVITQDDGIDEATVIGVHVPNMDGQAGLAAVVLASGQFDPARFWRVVSDLPNYAQPRFVRVMRDLAKTGTFKIQKNELRKDGVDPTQIGDPLYVRTSNGYQPLTPERWTEVKEGRLKL